MIGECHICGETKELTFEHVPPRKAFNSSRVLYSHYKPGQDLPPLLAPRKGRIQQKGLGAFTLCEKCNNDTGAWYGSRFVEYCKAGKRILDGFGENSELAQQVEFFPLAVLKQIVSMFLSINPNTVRVANPSLVEFVREKNCRLNDTRYRFFTYLNRTGLYRVSPITGVMGFDRNTMQFTTSSILSEFSFPPFGYIMTFDSSKPRKDLLEITNFKEYGYDDRVVTSLSYAVYETNSVYPLDYRSNQEISEAIVRGKKEMESWKKK